ncbi:hypothetical protein TRIP_B200101 [uncultured Desulfatiglans sp.]|nr:hypothetical protein TRIP_B200101 [uncultured Desulfatiglans sp.]
MIGRRVLLHRFTHGVVDLIPDHLEGTYGQAAYLDEFDDDLLGDLERQLVFWLHGPDSFGALIRGIPR